MNDVFRVIFKGRIMVKTGWSFRENVGLRQVLRKKATDCYNVVVIRHALLMIDKCQEMDRWQYIHTYIHTYIHKLYFSVKGI